MKELKAFELDLQFYRRCDSRNLNLSPLCNLEDTIGPAAWKIWAEKVYEKHGDTPDLLKKIPDGIRNYYPSYKLKKNELISSLTEVS